MPNNFKNNISHFLRWYNLESPLPNLECSLVELFHEPTKEKKRNSIFGHHDNDNEVIVLTRVLDVFNFKKISGRIETFTEHLNREFGKSKIWIHFSLLGTADGKEYFVFSQSEAGKKVKINRERSHTRRKH